LPISLTAFHAELVECVEHIANRSFAHSRHAINVVWSGSKRRHEAARNLMVVPELPTHRSRSTVRTGSWNGHPFHGPTLTRLGMPVERDHKTEGDANCLPSPRYLRIAAHCRGQSRVHSVAVRAARIRARLVMLFDPALGRWQCGVSSAAQSRFDAGNPLIRHAHQKSPAPAPSDGLVAILGLQNVRDHRIPQ